MKGCRGAYFETSCCPWRCLATRSRQFDATLGFPGEGFETTWKQRYGHSGEKLLQTPASLSGVLYSLAHTGGAKLTSFLRDAAHAVREQGPGFPESCDTSASQGGSPVTEFLPLPYPEIYRAKRKAHPSDKRLANLTVLVLNWLGAGSPSKVPKSWRLAGPATADQRRRLEHVLAVLQAWHGEEARSADELGRAEDKFRATSCVLRKLEALTAEFSVNFSKYSDFKLPVRTPLCPRKVRDPLTVKVGRFSEPVEGARPIVSSRLKVTGPPSFNADLILTGVHRQIMNDPRSARGEPPFEACPRVEVKASQSELVKLLEKFDASGRLHLSRADDPDLPPWDERVGLFTVYKEAGLDRLIVDARPPNRFDRALCHWVQHLGHPACLSDVHLDGDEVLAIYSSDIVDFYNRFVVTGDRTRRNTLKKTLKASALRHLSCCPHVPGDTDIAISLKILAMGDLQAVEIAQAAHSLICAVAGSVSDRSLISRLRPFPRLGFASGLCIDDFAAFEVEKGCRDLEGRLSLALSPPESATGSRRLESLKQAYRTIGLESHPKKEVRRASKAVVWGSETDGIAGTHAVPRAKLIALVSLTTARIDLGRVSVSLLESLVGMWGAVVLHHRRSFCLLDLCYEAVKRFDRTDVIQMSRRLKQEFLSLCILAPFMYADLRAGFGSELQMVDASSEKIAVVKAEVPSHVVKELSRHCLKKGRWARLLSPAQNWLRERGLLSEQAELPAGELLEEASTPLFEGLVPALRFETVHVSSCSQKDHINLSELKSIGAAERRCANFSPRSRPLIGGDSQVAVASVMKGRASSRVLNDQLKCMLFDVITGRLSSRFFWIASKLNPADDPTRGTPLRKPHAPEPAWFSSLKRDPKDFDALDRLLCSLYGPAEGPSLGELVRQHSVEQPGVLNSLFGTLHASCTERDCEVHDSVVEGCNSLTCRKNPNLSGVQCSAGYPHSSSVESCFGFDEMQASSVVSEGCNRVCFERGIRSSSSGFPLCADALSCCKHDDDSDGLQQFFPPQVHVKQQPSRATCQSWLLSHPALASVSRARFYARRELRRTGVLVRQELFACGEFQVSGESLCWIAGLPGCLFSVAAVAPMQIPAMPRIKFLLRLSFVKGRLLPWGFFLSAPRSVLR